MTSATRVEASASREQAIEIACRCAKAKPQSYYAEPFQPHEWVIDSIVEAQAPLLAALSALLTAEKLDDGDPILDRARDAATAAIAKAGGK